MRLTEKKIMLRCAASFLTAVTAYLTAYAGPAVRLAFAGNVLVNDTLFTVGDIASVTGNDAEAVDLIEQAPAGTSAPPSYGRFLSVDDLAARLCCKYPSIDIKITGPRRLLVTTDFREIKIQEHENEIIAYIDSTIGWKKGEWNVTIRNLSDAIKAGNAPAVVFITGLETDPYPRGTTPLVLHVKQGNSERCIAIQCFFTVAIQVLTAAHAIERGRIISPSDCEIRKMDITRFEPAPFTTVDMLSGKRTSRSIQPGAIIHERMLQSIPVIEKGDPVAIVHKCRGISILIAGTAREQGGTGECIWVENGASRKLIRAVIISRGKVAIKTGDAQI